MIQIAVAKRNRILSSIPTEDLARLIPSLKLVDVPVRTMLQRTGETAKFAYFPLAGVASMISVNALSQPVEVATIGHEGFVGLPLFLGADDSAFEVVMQVEGSALRIDAAAFRKEAMQPGIHRVMLLYVQALVTQIAQSSVCNRLHTLEQRCARWLLQTHDRVDADEFFLTQEFLAMMLAVRRAGVSEVATALQEEGLIRYVRGRMTILDRPGLLRRSCECYQVIAHDYDRLLGPLTPTASNAASGS